MTKTLKTFQFVPKTIDEENRTLTAVISDETLDRQGEITVQKGIDFTEFMKNPVVLDAHNIGSYGQDTPRDPIGKVLDVNQLEDRTEAKIQFTTEEENPAGFRNFLLYKGGFKRAWSVGLEVISQETRDLAGTAVNYLTSTRLLELSAVAVPANPNALVKSINQGDVAPEALDELIADLSGKKDDIMVGNKSKQDKSMEDKLQELSSALDDIKKQLTSIDSKVDTVVTKTDEPKAEEKSDEDKEADEAELEEAHSEGYAEEMNSEGKEEQEAEDNKE